MSAVRDAEPVARNWEVVGADLDRLGYACLPGLLDDATCAALIAGYARAGLYRSHIDMARYNFGRGEYKYFAAPLPQPVAQLRQMLYPPLAVIANRWQERLGRAALSGAARRVSRAPCRRADATDAVVVALSRRGLQLPASRPLRGGGLPLQVAVLLSTQASISLAASSCSPSSARACSHAWKWSAHARRRGRVRGQRAPRARHPRRLPRQAAAWCQSSARRRALHARHYFPRRTLTPCTGSQSSSVQGPRGVARTCCEKVSVLAAHLHPEIARHLACAGDDAGRAARDEVVWQTSE